MRYILLVLLFIAFPIATYAQEVNLGVSPLRHEIIAKPGSSMTLPYTLTNYGDAVLMTIKIVRLEITDSLGNYTLLPMTAINELEPHLSQTQVSEEPFLILAKEQYTGHVTVEIPADAKEKDYYYALMAQSQNSQGFETTSTVKLHAAVTSPIFISVTKNGITEVKLSKPELHLNNVRTFHVGSRSILIVDSKDLLNGTIAIENKSKNSTHVKNTSHITSSFSLWPFHDYNFDTPELNLLANSRRVIQLSGVASLPPGRYLLSNTMTAGSQVSTSNSISFIVFPLTFFAYVFIIAFLGLISFLIHKRYTNT
ncbi:hypothetical protein BH09PAT2_BH09PAT2_10950 [soil metagenome]